MSELVLDYRTNPGAMGASVGVVYFNASGRLCVVLNDGVERMCNITLADVVGPASATDGDLARFDGTSGKLLKAGIALSTSGTLTENSDVVVATQKAVKTYADALLAASDAMVYKGATNCSSNPNYPAANAGDTYRVSVAGKIGGASGKVVEAGDWFICNTDSTSSGDEAAQGTKWNVIQTNLDGAVLGPASATDGLPPLWDGMTGKLLKNATAAAVRAAIGLDTGNSPTFTNLTVTDTLYAGTLNDIGVAGFRGFGLGICPAMPAGFSTLTGTLDRTSDQYGNYQYSDGSIMCWIPAIYYKWGTGANGLAINAVSIKPLAAYANEAAANADGYALHRADYDNGTATLGQFVDKYICSKNGTTASSIKNGNPLSSNAAHNQFSDLSGSPPNFYYGAIAAAKTRGANFFCNSRFIFAKLALLSYAHAQASSNTTWCAYYDATYNTPKGCNNNALGDDRDATLVFTTDGYSNAAKTGSANHLAKTTHNGQACGVADLNGCMWEITPGLATDAGGAGYYVLKTSAQMKSVTGGNSGATDLWGATGIAALYDSLGATYEAAAASSTLKNYGAATQVLSAATSGNAWAWAGAGGALTAGVGGTNAFGSDGFWDYRPADMCPISGGAWADSSTAGVWALALNTARGTSGVDVGFRAALYL